MKAIDFYRFIIHNSVEWQWHINPDTKENDVLIFPNAREVGILMGMLSASIFDDDGIECRMKQGYFSIWASDILDYYDIELVEIFNPDENK